MVKKSILGRIFGKKDMEAKGPQNKDSKGISSTTGTATMTKKGSNTLQGSRMTGAVKEPRLERDRPDIPVEEKKPEVMPIEPEILTRTERAATESKEKIDVIAKKMSVQEEASVKISDGIKGLSSVLSNIDQRIQEQTQQSFEIAKTVKTIPEMIKDLPESSRAGVELLHSISQILENQSSATAELGKRISDLPVVLTNLTDQINKDQTTREQERSVIKETVEVVKKSVQSVEEHNEQISKTQAENTKKIEDSFKKVQEDHHRQIGVLVEKSKITNRLIVFLILVILAGMIAIVASIAA
jgi:hypothetical protein